MRWGSAGSAAVVVIALLVAGATVGLRVLGEGDAEPASAAVQHEELLASVNHAGGTAGLDVAPPPRPQVASSVSAAAEQVAPPSPTPEPTATPVPPTPLPEPTATPVPPAPAPAVEQPAAPTATPLPPTPAPVPPTLTPVPPTATPVPPTPTPRPPTATPTPTSTPKPVQALAVAIATATRTPLPFIAGSVSGKATPYADSLAGNQMGCNGAGPYNINDITVVAVSAAQHPMFPCGTKLEVCGQLGCITAYRKDSCPGCGNGDVDLSRAGFRTVCGNVNSCAVRTRSMP